MQYNIVEFFVGAGGSHLGFMQEGFNTLYANDFDTNALQTLKHNNKKHLKNAIIDSTDITQLNPKELKKKLDSSVDVMFGGLFARAFL
ncbi:two-component sensor [Campylobacter upsaliensis]|nr:two-component sensor [Campylobacter upsaliensis]